MKTSFVVVSAFAAMVGVGYGQTVEINRKPLTVSPAAEVGNKIKIKWNVFKEASVLLQVTDQTGKPLKTLDAAKMPAGEYAVIYDGKDAAGVNLPAGEYVVRVGINPRLAAEPGFGVNGLLGRVTKSFTFGKDRSFDLGAKGLDSKTVKVIVDGEAWERESDFAIAGDNFTVDATNGVVKLNPQGSLQDRSAVEISYALGLPLENPWALATGPDGGLLIVDNLPQLDLALKKPKPRTGLLYKVTPAGKVAAEFGVNGALDLGVKDIVVDQAGNIYVLPFDHFVTVLDRTGVRQFDVAGYKEAPKEGEARGGYWPSGIGLDRQHLRLFLANINEQSVIYDATKPGFDGYLAVITGKEGYALPPVYWQYWGPCVEGFNDDFYQTGSQHCLIKYHLDVTAKKVIPVWNTQFQDPTGATQVNDGPGALWHPMAVRADGSGLLYVANRGFHRIDVFYDAGTTVKWVAALGSKGTDLAKCQLMAPHGLALSPDGKSLYVADDGVFIKHGKEPINRGLGRVVKMNLGFAETIDIPLTVK